MDEICYMMWEILVTYLCSTLDEILVAYEWSILDESDVFMLFEMLHDVVYIG